MVEISLGLVLSAFVAGVLTFLAPCTLPLVPAYLAFISGVRHEELVDPAFAAQARRSIIFNGLGFILGFSSIFILFGMLAGLLGGSIGPLQSILTQVAGIFVIFFGLMLLGVLRVTPLAREYHWRTPAAIRPGNPLTSLAIGAAFALGWTPCIGPVLASILLIASTEATVLAGGVLLAIFSLGLAVPFFATAVLYAQAARTITKLQWLSGAVTKIGAIFLIGIGVLLLTDRFGLLVQNGDWLLELIHGTWIYQYL